MNGISILLASYNGEKYIKQSIDSIINQTFKKWELLIGFNGTTDKTKDIVDQYKDERIKIFDYEDDKGKAKTLNKLIQEAQFDYCSIQDDDDLWWPPKLHEQSKLLEEYQVIGTYIYYINSKNQIVGAPYLCRNHQAIKNRCQRGINQIANSSAVFSKSKVLSVGGWNEDLDDLADKGVQPKEDFDLWLRLLKNGSKFCNIPEYLTLHRIHKKSNFNSIPKK
jgi:glycosyltransferase involved in cell wall biosynthesis